MLEHYVNAVQVLSKQPLWNHLLHHYKENNCLVEGTLTNLKVEVVLLIILKFLSLFQRSKSFVSLISLVSFKFFFTSLHNSRPLSLDVILYNFFFFFSPQFKATVIYHFFHLI